VTAPIPLDGRPLVIAPRGASVDLAEHTLGAYVAAIEAGADGLECDVRLTADGHLVCVHDRTVDRTSDGTGAVSALELARLQELDFAGWRDNGDAPDVVDLESRRVLTLEALLELVLSYDRVVTLSIETKHPTRYAGYVEERLAEVLDGVGLAHPRLGEAPRVTVMSFSAFALRRFQRWTPSLPRVALLRSVPIRFRDGSLPPGVGIAGPSIDILREHPRYPARVRSHGHRVHCWTVDAPEDVERCVEAGVDAIITNRPREVLDHLDGRARTSSS
jgi:glycerophosphoryl diester phosphodiesterase